jgi:DNA modification methylase
MGTRKRKVAPAIEMPQVEIRKVAELEPAPYNPRTIGKKALDGLRASVKRFGLVQPLIVNKRTGHVVGGHQRLKLLADEGVEETQVIVVDLGDRDEKALNVSLNNKHITGDFTDDLQDVLSGLDVELDIGELVIDPLWAGPKDGAGDDEKRGGDEIPHLAPERAKPGDVFELGAHRMMCGDCRNASDVAKLFGDERAAIAFTSPPYASQRKYDESSGFKPIRPDEYVEWFDAVQANVRAILADDGSWFVNIKEHVEKGQRVLYVKDLALAHARKWGWLFVDEFAWTKHGVPGKCSTRLKNAWEPVFQFANKRASRVRHDSIGRRSANACSYSPSNKKTSTGASLLSASAKGKHYGRSLPSNVVNVESSNGSLHSAAFPVGLPDFFIRAFTDAGGIVFEPFSGSGTTIIAADRNERRCFAMEISPKYCDVALERWENETGKKARKVKA